MTYQYETIQNFKLTREQIEKILMEHLNMQGSVVTFDIGCDPTDDGPGYSRQILNGAKISYMTKGTRE